MLDHHVLTTGVSQRGLSRAGRCGPCARSASSTAFPRKWRAAIPYTPARLNIVNEHPGTTECSRLCGPAPELHYRRQRKEKKEKESVDRDTRCKLKTTHKYNCKVPRVKHYLHLILGTVLCIDVHFTFLLISNKRLNNFLSTWCEKLFTCLQVRPGSSVVSP